MKIVPLEDWNTVDVSLRALGMIQSGMDQLQAEYAQEAARIKAEYAVKVEHLMEQKGVIEKQVGDFVKKHREDLKGKSLELNFGTVGYRKAPDKIKFVWKVDNILQALKVKKLLDCIRVKEKPNKDALLLLADEILEDVGCKRTAGKDKFFVEPDLEKIKAVPGLKD
jgi:phage host-nuclease inhibitor protein Gam